MLENDLFDKINEKMKVFSKGQRKIATFILQNYDKAVFATAFKLGEMIGVSESTIIRFSVELGFDGYTKFQNELESIIKSKLTATQRMQISAQKMEKSENSILQNVLEKDVERIKSTLLSIDENIFNDCVKKIANAKKVYVIGVRSANSLSSFLGFYLNLILKNVVYVNSSTATELFEQIFRIEEGDVLIGISFPRYSRRTVKAMEYAYSKNATTIAITDDKSSPLVNFAKNSLIVRSDMASFIDSLVAPQSVINALLVAISIEKKEEVIKTLETLESIWEEYSVYSNYSTHTKYNIRKSYF